jgi:hypothetical protein
MQLNKDLQTLQIARENTIAGSCPAENMNMLRVAENIFINTPSLCRVIKKRTSA